jgi:LPXTG-motif cell wall-anchored protein
MGRRRQALACGLAAVALGLPSSAWAQGAGDEQYSDPFEDEQEQGGSQDTQEPEETPAPDTSTSSQEPAPAAQEPAPAAPAQAPAAEQLPRTGADADLLALGGTLLLAGGVALRVRVSERSPRRR